MAAGVRMYAERNVTGKDSRMEVNMNVSAPAGILPEEKADAGKKKRRRRKILRRIVILVLILVLLGGGGWLVFRKLKSDYTVTYQPYTVTRGTISNALSFSGNLQAVNSRTYEADTRVTVRNLYVKAGDTVRSGDRLMKLSNGQTLTADFDGTVNQLPVKEGDEVTGGTTLLQLVDFRHMRVSVRVDEYDISDVHAGDECRITATATEDVFESVIDNINYVSSSTGNVAYYTATAYVDVTGGVYPGMQVTLTVPQEEATDVVILKADALSFDRTNQAYVNVLNEKGGLERVNVQTGVSNGNYVEIRSGLESGDTVYVEAAVRDESGSILQQLFGGRNFLGGSQSGGGSQRSSGGGGSGFSGSGSGGSSRTNPGSRSNSGGGQP